MQTMHSVTGTEFSGVSNGADGVTSSICEVLGAEGSIFSALYEFNSLYLWNA